MLREHLQIQETDLSEFKEKDELVVIPHIEGIHALLLFKEGVLKDAIASYNNKIVHIDKEIFSKIFAYNILQSSFKLNKKLHDLSGKKAIAIEAIITIRVAVKAEATLITDILFRSKNLNKVDQLQLVAYDIYHYKDKELLPLLPLRTDYVNIAALAMLYLPIKDNAGFSGQKFMLTANLLKKQAKKCLTVLKKAYPNIAVDALLVTKNSTKNTQKYSLLRL